MVNSNYFKDVIVITYFAVIVVHLVPILCKQNARYGFLQLSASNFEDTVMNGSKDAWIVAVKGAGKIPLEKWVELETLLRGMSVRVGIVDSQKDGAFLKRQGLLRESKVFPAARVYPYGGPKIKQAAYQDVKTLSEARKAALRTLPDDTTSVRGKKQLQEFVNRAYTTSPPRFPVLLFTDKSTTAPLFRAAALKYSKYFHFGVIQDPSEEERQNYQIKSLPAMLVMMATVLPDERMTFGGIHYERDAYGPINYLTFTKFLYSVHEKHWSELPNISHYKGKFGLRELYIEDTRAIIETRNLWDQDDDEENELNELPTIREITWQNQKSLCADSALGLCLITFIDGRDKRAYEAVMKVLRRTQRLSGMKGKPLHYLWVNSTCHPEYGEVFGVYPENLPVMLIARPKRRLFTTLRRQNLNGESIKETVAAILRGDGDMMRYSRFDDMKEVDCSEKQRNGTHDTIEGEESKAGDKNEENGGTDTRKEEL